MARKTSAVKKQTAQEEETFEMPSVPKLPNVGKYVNPKNIAGFFKKIKPTSYSQIMVILLILAAFLIGVLYTKVQYLQGNGGSTAAVQSGTATTVVAPGTNVTPAAAGAPVNVSDGNLAPKGDTNAKVTVIEFADFRCPFCEQFFTQTESQLLKDYVDTGKVKFVFRNFAFLGPASVTAADAAECANDQGKFWEYHDWLYKNQPDESNTTMYNTDALTQAAVTLGMNGDTFRSCLSNKTDESKVNQDMTDGTAAGVSGTPTFFVNGTSLVGAEPYATIKASIDSALAAAK